MPENTKARGQPTLVFGAFRLDVLARRLTEAGRLLPIGDRALELLIALTERPGEVVSKWDLMSRIWPNTHVEEANLRVQVATLRRALGRNGEDYVANAPGRGYRFAALVEPEAAGGNPPAAGRRRGAHRLLYCTSATRCRCPALRTSCPSAGTT